MLYNYTMDAILHLHLSIKIGLDLHVSMLSGPQKKKKNLTLSSHFHCASFDESL